MKVRAVSVKDQQTIGNATGIDGQHVKCALELR
jgi:hypothetical protein